MIEKSSRGTGDDWTRWLMKPVGECVVCEGCVCGVNA